MQTDTINYQASFQQRWSHLRHSDVRSLAWLLDSPVLLNLHHARWANKLAQLPAMNSATEDWLVELNHDPKPLADFLAVHPHTRLGHFAENLLAFYFQWRGELVAHSVQVRSHTTIGEFDFLLNNSNGFEHWEFACKFYLYVEHNRQLSDFVGPNLMDNLNDKSRKIIDAQLMLGQHADALKYLPQPLSAARALLKGWLFYPPGESIAPDELDPLHCRGIWCRLSDLDNMNIGRTAILSRLSWLAPALVDDESTLSSSELKHSLARRFEEGDTRPVLIATLQRSQGDWVEDERVFVVPDGWNKK